MFTPNSKPRDEKGEWWKLQDDEMGIPYYYNTSTGEAEWEPPKDATIIPFEAFMASTIWCYNLFAISILVTGQLLPIVE